MLSKPSSLLNFTTLNRDAQRSRTSILPCFHCVLSSRIPCTQWASNKYRLNMCVLGLHDQEEAYLFLTGEIERLGIEKSVMTKSQPSVSLVKNASVLFIIVKNETLKMCISNLHRATLSRIPASGLMKLVKSK